VVENNVAEVRRLLAAGADVNEEMDRQQYPSMRPLHLSVEERHHEIAKLLLEAGADVEAEVSWRGGPIEMALRNSDVEMVRLLLDHGADPNGSMWARERRVRSHLHRAVYSVHASVSVEMVRLLLDRGAEVTHEVISWILSSGNAYRPREVISEIMDMMTERYPEAIMEYWIAAAAKPLETV